MLDHRRAVAGRFGELDASWDHGSEDEFGEVVAQLPLDVLGEAGALIVHGDQQTRQLQRRVQLTADQRQRVEELDQALERQVLRLDRDDHPIGGGEGIDRDRAERRRAVEQRVGEAIPDRAEPAPQAALRALDPRQLDRGAGEVAGGGDEPEVVGPGRVGPPPPPRPRRPGSRRRRGSPRGRRPAPRSRCTAGRGRRSASAARWRRRRRPC